MKPVKIALVVIWIAALLSGVFMMLNPPGKQDVTEAMDALGRDLYAEAQDMSLSSDTRLNACDLYIKYNPYFKEPDYLKEIKEIKTELGREPASPATAEEPAPAPESGAVSRMSANNVIDSYATLFEQLGDAGAVMEGAKSYVGTHKFSGPDALRLRGRAIAIVEKALRLEGSMNDKMRAYDEAYHEAQKESSPKDRLYRLEKLLKSI